MGGLASEALLPSTLPACIQVGRGVARIGMMGEVFRPLAEPALPLPHLQGTGRTRQTSRPIPRAQPLPLPPTLGQVEGLHPQPACLLPPAPTVPGALGSGTYQSQPRTPNLFPDLMFPLPGGGVPMKSTTLYVGRIAPSVEDSVLRELLEACGEVQVWKPTLDPDTSKFKGFGFCTYAEPEGVSIAIRVLNNLNVDGQQLIAKTNKVLRRG